MITIRELTRLCELLNSPSQPSQDIALKVPDTTVLSEIAKQIAYLAISRDKPVLCQNITVRFSVLFFS